MTACPDCSGSGLRRLDHVRFADGRAGSGFTFSCTRCGETGRISDAMLGWIARGQAMRDRRVAAGVALRAEAARRGLTPAALSAMEMGRVEPVEDKP